MKFKSQFSAREISLNTAILLMKIYANKNSKPFIKSSAKIFQPEKGKGEGFHHFSINYFTKA